jgi:hypothetical protein
LFGADREHIHHKLLQQGLSHRQVVIVLYLVSALFAMLSLFLLWPTGSTLGLVLAVVGTGIWLGVQHLNYLEFGEIKRVAQRTMEQRQIVINNLAIRRAVEQLKSATDYDQVLAILVAAFDNNDFDAFQLQVRVFPDDLAGGDNFAPFSWSKLPQLVALSALPSWKMSLDLVSSSDRRRGSLIVHRAYSPRNLQLDVNLVTSDFPLALADAIDRILTTPKMVPYERPANRAYLSANL